MKTIFTLWFGILALPIIGVGNPLITKISPTEIQPGERVRLEIILEAKNSGELEPEIRDDLLLKDGQIQLLDQFFERDEDSLRWVYDFTAYDEGEFRIPPLEIRLGADTYSTESTVFQAVTQRSHEDETLRGDQGLVSKPIPWLTLLLVFIVGGVLWYFRNSIRLPKWRWALKKRKSHVPVFTEDELKWLRRELDRIRNELKNHPDRSDKLVDQTTLALREFCKRRFSPTARSWTSTEILWHLSQLVEQAPLAEICQECDRYQFGPEKTRAPQVVEKSTHNIEKLFLCSKS